MKGVRRGGGEEGQEEKIGEDEEEGKEEKIGGEEEEGRKKRR